MKSQAQSALQQRNRDLQKRALRNFRVLLKRVCQVHNDQSWAISARKLIEHDFTKDRVKQLVDLADSLSKQKYMDAKEHFFANQFSLLVRKYPFPDEVNPFTPEEDAYRKFVATEHHCHRINQRLRARLSRKGKPAPYEYYFQAMRSFITYVIGERPDLKSIYAQVGFGPGASVGVSGNATNIGRKILSRWSVTPGAYMYGFAATMGHAQMREHMFPNPGGFTSCSADYDPFTGPYSEKSSIVAYNKIAFVPKTAKIFRSIAVEPLLNGFLQKGVDNCMRSYLKRVGIDLSAQDPNSEMARQGSIAGVEDPFVTIDLASASDSISIGIVRNLLPPDWFDFLNSIRSPSYSYRGRITRFNKFCSMGNGFCFPLETLLFTAACSAVGAGRPGIDFRVYGDDIIVRRSKADTLIDLLHYMGFDVNTEKTFLEGPFRESCGKDWFDGKDVRPYTLDFALDSIQALFKFLNGCLRNDFTRSFFDEIRPLLLRWVPPDFRFFRPYPGPEDTGIDSYCDEFLTCPHATYRFKNGTGSWRWKELIASPIRDREISEQVNRSAPYALVYAALTGSASSLPFAIRRKTRTKVRLVSHPGAISQWLPPGGVMLPS